VVNDAKVTITREGAGFTAIIDLLPGSLGFGCSVMLNAHGQSAEEAECRARVLYEVFMHRERLVSSSARGADCEPRPIFTEGA
jgi:hypothetical protein